MFVTCPFCRRTWHLNGLGHPGAVPCYPCLKERGDPAEVLRQYQSATERPADSVTAAGC